MADVSECFMIQSPQWSREARKTNSPGDVSFLIEVARRNRGLIVRGAVIGLTLALGVQIFWPRSYSTSAEVVIDFRRLASINISEALANYRLSDGAIESQVAIILSDGVLGQAVDALDLTHDPQFVGPSFLISQLAAVGFVSGRQIS